MAVPGLLLSGWAPARAMARPVELLVRPPAHDTPVAESLMAGVRLGLADVERLARITGTPLSVRFVRHDEPVRRTPHTTMEVVVAVEDDRRMSGGGASSSIYTCPLHEWRADVWSVACSSPAWSWPLTHDGEDAARLDARFRAASGQPMDEAAWRGWMAVRVAYDAALRTQAGESDLRALEFDGCKGQRLRFSEDGHLGVRQQA